MYRTCGLVSYRSVIPLIHHSAIYEICDDEHMVISTDGDGHTIVSTSILVYTCKNFSRDRLTSIVCVHVKGADVRKKSFAQVN